LGTRTEKNNILDFTHHKFISQGFCKTTIDEIASELKISKKTIYKYFPSKLNLVEEVVNLRIKLINESIDSILDSRLDAVTKFVKILNVQKVISMGCSNLWYRDLQTHAPHLMKKIDKVRSDKITKIMTRLLEQGNREKVIEKIPPDIIITALNGAIEAVTSMEFISNSRYSLGDVLGITSEIFLKGIFTSKGRFKYSDKRKLLNIISNNS
jgi:AcrR family transcriptional regulator